ncbi:MAG: hypothetical protein CYPHOPRED_002079 [Cyphobasidiales sp. Tagirdzhanova-0007]|nr:MAG: hypothetical protein CYPHOPRED_002079 [Cyphobasidiales sp. Tagirdzhanova-0007]
MKLSLLLALAPFVAAAPSIQRRDNTITAATIAPVLTYLATLTTNVTSSLSPIPIAGGNLSVGQVNPGVISGPGLNATLDGGLFYTSNYGENIIPAFYGYGSTSDNYTFLLISSSIGVPGGNFHGYDSLYIGGNYVNESESFLISDVQYTPTAGGNYDVKGLIFSVTN